MKSRIRKLLTVVLSITLLAGLAGVVYQQVNYSRGEADYSAAEELAGMPKQVEAVPAPPPATEKTEEAEEAVPPQEEDPVTAALAEIDLAALQAVNSDVLGWIVIPGTEVNYPLMRRDDNDYYLKHTWAGESSSVGAIFMDCRNSADFSDGNTIIYGHNMRNRSMFGSLKYYKNDGYWEEHPSVYIVDAAGARRYDIYTFYNASVRGETYDMTFADDAAKESFIRYGLNRSAVRTGIVPTAEDSIITLSTCTGGSYEYRWVLQAVLVENET